MVSAITSGLNSLFASFSELNKVAPNNLRPPVDNAKRITPEQARETIDGYAQQQQNRGKSQQSPRFNLPDDRQPSFASFSRPQVALNPADEVALFSLLQAADAEAEKPLDFLELSQELPPQGIALPSVQDNPQSRRRQSYVAQLYAQTNDIAFSSDKVLNQAA